MYEFKSAADYYGGIYPFDTDRNVGVLNNNQEGWRLLETALVNGNIKMDKGLVYEVQKNMDESTSLVPLTKIFDNAAVVDGRIVYLLGDNYLLKYKDVPHFAEVLLKRYSENRAYGKSIPIDSREYSLMVRIFDLHVKKSLQDKSLKR